MEHDDRYRQITARMVLSHSSGLPNWGGDRLDLEFDPGSGFRYSGEGYVYLQRVLEMLADRPLADIARDELFDPLQMDQTSFVWIDAFENRSAFGHDAVGRSHAISRPRDANAAASLLTTAGDYGRFLATVIARKRLSSEGYDEMFRPAVEVFRRAGLETFRIGFEIDESGAGSSIVGLYMDGSRDETPRTR